MYLPFILQLCELLAEALLASDFLEGTYVYHDG